MEDRILAVVRRSKELRAEAEAAREVSRQLRALYVMAIGRSLELLPLIAANRRNMWRLAVRQSRTAR